MYEIVKHLHVTVVFVSLLLFSFRFALLYTNNSMLQSKPLKIIPHVIDTVLLGSAIWLLTLSPMLGVDGWVASKVLGVVLYILSGFYAFKWAKNQRMRILGFFSAVVWMLVTISVAYSKSPLPMFT